MYLFLVRRLTFLLTFYLFHFVIEVYFSFDWSLLMTFLSGIWLILIRVLGKDWSFHPRLAYCGGSRIAICLFINLRIFLIDFFLFDLTVKFKLFSVGIQRIGIRRVKLQWTSWVIVRVICKFLFISIFLRSRMFIIRVSSRIKVIISSLSMDTLR